MPCPAGRGDPALCHCLSRMVHPTLFFWLLVAGLDPHACGQGVPDRENHPTPVNPLASSTFLNNPHFASSLHRRMVAANPGKNIIFSPLSFSIPLTLLALQPGQRHARRSWRVWALPSRRSETTGVHAHYSQQLLASLRPLAACGADVGSLLFVDQKRYLAQRFVDIAQNLYHTEVFPIPFGNNRVAREQMDHFISKMTHGKIGTLAQELNPDTVLILANYIFFKGKTFSDYYYYYLDPSAVCLSVFCPRRGFPFPSRCLPASPRILPMNSSLPCPCSPSLFRYRLLNIPGPSQAAAPPQPKL